MTEHMNWLVVLGKGGYGWYRAAETKTIVTSSKGWWEEEECNNMILYGQYWSPESGKKRKDQMKAMGERERKQWIPRKRRENEVKKT